MTKRSDIREDIHKQMILEYIRTRSLSWVGVEVKNIINYIRLRDTEKHRGISRQAINTHLNKLVAEGEIKKTRKGRYLSREIFDDIVYDPWGVYESCLNMMLPFIIEDGNVLNLQSLWNIVLTLKNGSNWGGSILIIKTILSILQYRLSYENNYYHPTSLI